MMKTTTLLALAAASLLLMAATPSATALRIHAPPPDTPTCTPTAEPTGPDQGLQYVAENTLHGATTTGCDAYYDGIELALFGYQEGAEAVNEIAGEINPIMDLVQDPVCAFVYGEEEPEDPSEQACEDLVTVTTS